MKELKPIDDLSQFLAEHLYNVAVDGALQLEPRLPKVEWQDVSFGTQTAFVVLAEYVTKKGFKK